MQGTFQTRSLIPLISWEHFFFPWEVRSDTSEADNLKQEALDLLRRLEDCISVSYMMHPYVAKLDGDDILLNGQRIPFLRQQVPNGDGSCLCMSDFVCEGDTIAVFATTVGYTDELPLSCTDDPFTVMLLTTLSDRLAEAAAEQVQADAVRTLDFRSDNVIRPAVGYPSIPDMSINFLLNGLCHFDRIGITLTENGMMQPHSSVSGFIISHPLARYFSIGRISEEQVEDYAMRRGLSVDETKKYIYA